MNKSHMFQPKIPVQNRRRTLTTWMNLALLSQHRTSAMERVLQRASCKVAMILGAFVFLAGGVRESSGQEKSARVLSGDNRRAAPQPVVRDVPGARSAALPPSPSASSEPKANIPSVVAGAPAPVASASDAKAGASSGNLAALPNTMEGLNDKRQLTIGDRISFSVVEDETPPNPLSVTDSGEIEFPYIGRLGVANKTCKQLAYQVKNILEKEYYYQATVLIGLNAAGGRAVSRGRLYVMGQVKGPGPQEIPADEVYTVSKAVMRAGGFAPFANKRKVKLVRGGTSRGDTETIIVDLVEILEKGQSKKDPEVGPDDLIVVPEKLFNF